MENREWREYRFSDFVDINPSVTLKANEEYSFVEMKDLEDGNKYCFPKIKKIKGGGAKFQNGDTLFARITPCLENGKICQVKGLENNLGFGSTEFYVFRGNKDISDTEFVYYLSRWNDVRDHAEINLDGTSGRQRVPKASFDDLQLLMPPLQEQKAIASVLSSLDDKIDLLHQQNQTLEALAETLFRQWFIEEAKEDWEELPFSEWISETVGGDWGKETLQGEFVKEVYCIRGTDIADLLTGIPMKTPIRFVKEKKFQSIEPKEGDIIIEISGGTENQSTGRAYFINNEIKSLFSKNLVFSNFCRLICIKNSNYSFFVYLYLKYLYDQDEFFNLENGSSGIKNLDYKSLLFENKYKMPKEDLVLRFNDLVSDNYKKINHNKFQIQTLTKLRDTLLPKLMSGEVRVQL